MRTGDVDQNDDRRVVSERETKNKIDSDSSGREGEELI